MTELIKKPISRKSWYALYTRPKFEKRIASTLGQQEIRAFLPTHSITRNWSDRKTVVDEPLFPSYVFVFANFTERYESLQSTGVVRMVQFNGKPAQIPDEQIHHIRRLLNSDFALEPHEYLRAGDEVEIIAGPLRGVKGYFVEERGNERLVISIHSIQQSLAIELGRGQIKKHTSQDLLFRNRQPRIS